jgi:hypothetical protein
MASPLTTCLWQMVQPIELTFGAINDTVLVILIKMILIELYKTRAHDHWFAKGHVKTYINIKLGP